MIEAHYSTNTKVKRSKLNAVEAPNKLPSRVLFSDRDAEQKMYSINTDIYQGAKKEKEKHDLNKKLYLKIFGGTILLGASIAGISKIRNFFRKS